MNEYAVYILTHGRAKTQKTERALRNGGYTGNIFFVVDDLDTQLGEYKRLYGDAVRVFDKRAESNKTDAGKNNYSISTSLYARKAVYGIAESDGYRRFITMDDDLGGFYVRYLRGGHLLTHKIRLLDGWLGAYVDFAERSGAAIVGCGFQGDYIGGRESRAIRGYIRRTAYQVMVCDTANKVSFVSAKNDDMASDLLAWRGGQMVFSVLPLHYISPIETGGGGNRESYSQVSKYEFYANPLLWCPTAMRLQALPDGKIRQKVIKEWAFPKIIREEHKK